ncbi:Spermidine/putrescine import ATP-binding protein PotA [Aquisphaera giovannonii]|uniref:Spermidine/putrescine import ATP-binding protein PotA n=1 Tax=Aquisphaera giovannonii TaxID=406548 RepID=A0A5B9W1Y8_9BACT|nr:ATP-binding cassette domain-containing protein [Aquisphaera giovannonii]QEH34244.1 Spermidine/putrescine import ATP-binding protein PotA [Aquisphaera giovannonii]
MSDDAAGLDVRLVRRLRDGLTVDVAFRLGPEIAVLFGPSASGKTSILRLITGLLRPDGGHVRLGGEALFDAGRGIDLPLRRRRIGMIFQDDLLFPHLRVGDNIGFGLAGSGSPARRARIGEVAALCGVEHLLDRRPAMLSGGERQRVGLARALAPRPRLLLCDEPVSALDVAGRHVLLDRLRAVQRSEAIPVLYVTHSPAEAVGLGTHLILLRRGTIAAEGPPLEVLTGAAAALGPIQLDGVRNALAATIEGHEAPQGSTRLRLMGGPPLIVPHVSAPVGAAVTVTVRSDDILLARGPVAGLSAQNLIPGTVERIAPHGAEAEVLVRTGAVAWIVSIVLPVVEQLGLSPGVDVHMIIKARSCRVDHPADAAGE